MAVSHTKIVRVNGCHHDVTIWWDDNYIVGHGSSHLHSKEHIGSGETPKGKKYSSWLYVGVGYQIFVCFATFGKER